MFKRKMLLEACKGQQTRNEYITSVAIELLKEEDITVGELLELTKELANTIVISNTSCGEELLDLVQAEYFERYSTYTMYCIVDMVLGCEFYCSVSNDTKVSSVPTLAKAVNWFIDNNCLGFKNDW